MLSCPVYPGPTSIPPPCPCPTVSPGDWLHVPICSAKGTRRAGAWAIQPKLIGEMLKICAKNEYNGSISSSQKLSLLLKINGVLFERFPFPIHHRPDASGEALQAPAEHPPDLWRSLAKTCVFDKLLDHCKHEESADLGWSSSQKRGPTQDIEGPTTCPLDLHVVDTISMQSYGHYLMKRCSRMEFWPWGQLWVGVHGCPELVDVGWLAPKDRGLKRWGSNFKQASKELVWKQKGEEVDLTLALHLAMLQANWDHRWSLCQNSKLPTDSKDVSLHITWILASCTKFGKLLHLLMLETILPCCFCKSLYKGSGDVTPRPKTNQKRCQFACCWLGVILFFKLGQLLLVTTPKSINHGYSNQAPTWGEEVELKLWSFRQRMSQRTSKRHTTTLKRGSEHPLDASISKFQCTCHGAPTIPLGILG